MTGPGRSAVDPVPGSSTGRVAAFGFGVLALVVPLAASAVDPPANVGKTVVIDGKPLPTNGKIVTIDGNRILFDGRPAVVDGKPLMTDGHSVLLDGKSVVQDGRFLGRQPLLVFTIDTTSPGSSAYRMERDVSTPIERATKNIPGVIEARLEVVGHRSQTRLSFAPSTDPISTQSLIRLRVEQIKGRLPRDASRPLIAWRRETPDDAPGAR